MIVLGMDDVRFVEFFSIAIDDAIAQAQAIAGKSDDAFHYVQARLDGREENDDVTVLYLAVGKQRPAESGLRRGSHAVNKDMVADQQRLHHGRRRDLER